MTGMEYKRTAMYVSTVAQKSLSQRFLEDKVVAKTNHK